MRLLFIILHIYQADISTSQNNQMIGICVFARISAIQYVAQRLQDTMQTIYAKYQCSLFKPLDNVFVIQPFKKVNDPENSHDYAISNNQFNHNGRHINFSWFTNNNLILPPSPPPYQNMENNSQYPSGHVFENLHINPLVQKASRRK